MSEKALWALGVIGVGILFYLLKGFWEHSGKKLADKIFPTPPDADSSPAGAPVAHIVAGQAAPAQDLVEVHQQFQPQGEHATHCAWVRQAQVHVRVQEGYTFYTEAAANQRFYRDINAGREFLMIRPPHMW
jgi:hypothetical protein